MKAAPWTSWIALEGLMPFHVIGNIRKKTRPGTNPTRCHKSLRSNRSLGPPTESRYPQGNGLTRG